MTVDTAKTYNYAITVERVHKVNVDGTVDIVVDELELIREILNRRK